MTTPNTANKCVYPSEEQIAFIGAGMFNAAGGIYASCVEDFVHAICDWQREQDALICEKQKGSRAIAHFFASAIRSPIPQEGGKHE